MFEKLRFIKDGLEMKNKKTGSVLFLLLLTFLLYPEGFMCFSKDYKALRSDMVATQIKQRGVTNPKILDAMLKVERHRFVPDIMKPLAYNDGPLPIGEGQTISQPYIVALMTDCIISGGAAESPEKLRILEIGTGSGYQAAILGELSYEVYTIEIVEQLGKIAEKLLMELGYKNVFVRTGDGYKGWPEKAPFDRIIVTCAPDEVPKPLLDQLNPDGGRMIIPVGPRGDTQQLILIKRSGNNYIRELVTYVMFVPMTGEGVKKN